MIRSQSRIGEASVSASNFRWRALLILLFGVGLHYLHNFTSRHPTHIGSYAITLIHVAFLVFIPVTIAKSRGNVLARTLLLVGWLGCVSLIARATYLFFTGD